MLCAGTKAESGGKGWGLVGATSTNVVGMLNADAADIGVGSLTSPSFAHIYAVEREAEVSVAVVVSPAAAKVVVCVTTTVMSSVLVLFGALEPHTWPRSLEGMVHSREVTWTVWTLGIEGSENVTRLWLDGSVAPPLTVRTAGVGSLVALAIMSEEVGMAILSALIRGTIAVS